MLRIIGIAGLAAISVEYSGKILNNLNYINDW
jgi:hypothetical protein